MGKFSRLGNDLYSGKRSVDFVGRTRLWFAISGVIIIAAVLGLYFKGLNYGIEFVGGAQYTVSVPSGEVTQANADKLRDAVAGDRHRRGPAGRGHHGRQELHPGRDRAAHSGGEQRRSPRRSSRRSGSPRPTSPSTRSAPAGARRSPNGRSPGSIVFLILVVLLIWGYFRQWKMSVAAIVALIHDLIITIGIYALSGFEVTPATVTGVLTILGFSLYDTVVVFDKVRENTKNLRESHQTYAEAANLAVNQTLVRSINTSIVALIPVGRDPLRRCGPARQRAAQGPRAGALRRHGGRRLLLDLHRHSAARLHEDARARVCRSRRSGSRPGAVTRSTPTPRCRRTPTTCRSPQTPTRLRPGATGEPAATPSGGNRPLPSTDAVGRGRVVPPSRGPVAPSPASGRVQPTRQTRSKRGKK